MSECVLNSCSGCPDDCPCTDEPQPILYTHPARAYQPNNVNALHQDEQVASGLNTQLAVWLTRHIGTMTCAYLFATIGIGSLIGVFTGNVLLAAVCGSLSSYFLQLVLLPILAVGQNVLARKQELQADEMFTTTQQSFADIEHIVQHLNQQDTAILAIQRKLDQEIAETLAQIVRVQHQHPLKRRPRKTALVSLTETSS